MRLRTLILLLCASASAADLKLAWDDTQTGVSYNVYEQVAGRLVKLGTATEKEFSLSNVAKGPHTYVVTAANAQAESVPSDALTVPGSVTGLKATLFLEIK